MLDLITAYENYLTKVKKSSANTVASYIRDIRQFQQWLAQNGMVDFLSIKQPVIREYLSYLDLRGKSKATASRCVASIKNFYSYLMSSGFAETNPASDVHIERGEKKLPQILSGREIELLLAQPVCVDVKGYRDKAMLEVLYATGIRVSELIELNLEDVNIEQGTIKCNCSKKSRTIPLYPAARKALKT